MNKTIRETRPEVISQILQHCDITSGMIILEPSAGSGNLADGIINHNDINIDCVELNKDLRDELIKKGYNVIGEDFLQLPITQLYDYVIAAPTYKNNVDIEHIMKMYQHVKPHGYVVSLTSPFWTIRNNPNQIKFRKWLEDKKYSMVMLPDMSFVENDQTQPSMIIKIEKV
jgi:cyclopropane fatty-acyl-phospholipid synthase-like methyltransferase